MYVKETLAEFNEQMKHIEAACPDFYAAFMAEKAAATTEGRLSAKIKWLMVLTASVSHHCPVCIARAVKRCLDAGWSREEILEASMTAVLVGGSATMTYATLVSKALDELVGAVKTA